MAARAPGEKTPFWRLRLLGAALALAAVAFWGWGKLHDAFALLRISTAEVAFGTAESVFHGSATILRSETVVLSDAPGRVTLLVGEGRHVRAGDVIMELNAAGELGSVPVGLSEINRQLHQLDVAVGVELSRLEAEIRDASERLADAERVARDALASGDPALVQEAMERKTTLEERISSLSRQAVQLEQEREQRRNELLSQRAALLQLRPHDAWLVRAPSAGFVSFSLDNLEHVLTPGISLETYRAASKPTPSRVEDGVVVGSGAPLFRLVSNERMEVIVEVKGPFPLQPGSAVHLSFRSTPERTFRGHIAELESHPKQSAARVAIAEFDASLLHRRFDDVTLSAQRSQGVLVPTRSLVEIDGRRGVYVMVGDRPVFRRVEVLGGNSDVAVIDSPDGVPVGARVVTNPRVLR